MANATERHNRRVMFRRRELLRLFDLREELQTLLERLYVIGDEITTAEKRIARLRRTQRK